MAKGHENLIPQSQRTKEEQREIARKGGEASGKVRQEKARLRKTMEMLLNNKIETPLADGKVSAWEAITLGQIHKAASGDTAAYNAIRDIIGEKPKDELDAKIDAKIDFNLKVKK